MILGLTSAETRKAARMAQDESITLEELAKLAQDQGKTGDIATWAIWLRGDKKRRDEGRPLHGYTGRNGR